MRPVAYCPASTKEEGAILDDVTKPEDLVLTETSQSQPVQPGVTSTINPKLSNLEKWRLRWWL